MASNHRQFRRLTQQESLASALSSTGKERSGMRWPESFLILIPSFGQAISQADYMLKEYGASWSLIGMSL